MEIKKFENENIEIFKTEEINNHIVSDEEINEKYISGEVRIVTEQARYPLDTICTMLNSGKYQLRPDFQRRRRWERPKQSRLIESFIMNIPIPPIFLYEYEFSKYEVMDGLQRLTAIKEFYDDKFPLEGLEYWKELNGKKYSELPQEIKSGIDRRYLSSLILLKETANSKTKADEMKQLVFERINSGGVKLEYQESRNALYSGNFNDLVITLSRNEYFCKIFDIPISEEETEELANNTMYKTMADVEMVVRFFAMRYLDEYEGITLKVFFDKFTDSANKLSQSVLDDYQHVFEQTIKLVFDIYGEQAFCLYKQISGKEQWYLTRNPKKTIYDPVMTVLSQKLDYADSFLKNKDQVMAATIELMKNQPELFNGRKGTKSDIAKRIDAFDAMFNKFIQ
ncbi:DUF262 domain-containing protein [Segatella copri]|jgi:hypothetical protein|uniref:DUF262 domain-containing protein n=1 Tax=Segatella copri TaxID=165179 RepID=UPI0012912A6F|nr:DUF262 domain-containing protein [Segatella copri]MQM46284.1 DUF262 domain-containing protein [Segatella copri]MQM48562.1 DUF262 domain-containing protein [Segatella copri]MQM67578.1 DUF262 domain-containing protein [Segatella copri]MQM76162.1 DUF262 domain-containing protein [Segatella copri]MQM85270.1 DUF262 domain-containing protein [Segatella copri]